MLVLLIEAASATIPVLALTASRVPAALTDVDALLVQLLATLVFTSVKVLISEQTGTAAKLLDHDISVVEGFDVLL